MTRLSKRRRSMSRSEARHSAGPRPRARLTVRGTLVGFVVAVLGLALVGTAGPASAAVPTLGTTTPSVSGTAVSTVAVSDAITWTTSGGCSAVSGLSGAPYVHITIDGPGWAGIDLNTPNRNGVSLGGAFPQPQSDTFSGVQSSNALPALAGDYTVTESCQNSTGLSISGQFVATSLVPVRLAPSPIRPSRRPRRHSQWLRMARLPRAPPSP